MTSLWIKYIPRIYSTKIKSYLAYGANDQFSQKKNKIALNVSVIYYNFVFVFFLTANYQIVSMYLTTNWFHSSAYSLTKKECLYWYWLFNLEKHCWSGGLSLCFQPKSVILTLFTLYTTPSYQKKCIYIYILR